MKTKLCGWPGCSCITTGSYYCAKHKTMADKRNVEREKEHAFKNATRYADYRDPRWRKLSAQVINEVGQCERCGCSNNLQVHHIIPVRYNPELFLDRANLIVLCRECHQRETQREISERKKRRFNR